MTCLAARHSLRLAGIVIWIGLLAGCVPADRWAVFADSPRSAAGAEDKAPAVTPVALQLPETQLPEPPPSPEIPVELSVEQAVIFALRNNRDLQVRQLSPVIVGTFEQIERGVFDPELFAEAEYFKEKASEVSRSSGQQFDVSAEDTVGIVGLRQRLPSGTDIEAAVSQERNTSNRSPEQQTARLGLSVTQSLLRGFGPAVNLVSVRQAELDTMASLEELRGFSEALLAETEIAYWQLVLAEQEIAIFEQSLQLARKQREEVELSIDVGLLPEIEAAASRAEEALNVQALINGRSQLEDRRLRLVRLVSPSSAEHFERRIETTSPPRIEAQPIDDLADRLALAEQARPDLNEARLRLQQNRLETIVTRNGLLPRLDLFIALGKTGFADTFSDTFREMDGGDTYDLRFGVRLSQYLDNRAARARNLAAYASRQQALEAVANLRQLVQLDVRLAVNEVERLRQQIDASRATRIFQEQTLNAEEERFAVGATTSLQVARAQRELLRTQITEVESIVNYRIALVRLYLAEGSLLERRGVSIGRQTSARF